jgi:hypothetical protein
MGNTTKEDRLRAYKLCEASKDDFDGYTTIHDGSPAATWIETGAWENDPKSAFQFSFAAESRIAQAIADERAKWQRPRAVLDGAEKLLRENGAHTVVFGADTGVHFGFSTSNFKLGATLAEAYAALKGGEDSSDGQD